jgi:hypothetical protein
VRRGRCESEDVEEEFVGERRGGSRKGGDGVKRAPEKYERGQRAHWGARGERGAL